MAEQDPDTTATTTVTATTVELECTQIRIRECPKTMPDIKEHFEFVTKCKLPALTENQLLIEPEYVSVDPYQRSRMKFWFAKDPHKQMHSFTVAKVLKSKSLKYKEGDYVYGVFPWSSLLVTDADKIMTKIPPNLSKYDVKADKDYIPGLHDDDDDGSADQNDSKKNESEYDASAISKIPRSYFVGSCGMPGMTAYYGMLYRGKLKRGENVLISGAAGAVGSLCGQIAKNVFGCHVIGICGTKEKEDWLVNDLGFDGVINYKSYAKNDYKKVTAVLKERFPNGIDLFFDNVGGIFSECAFDVLNVHARVLVCGQISTYNDDPADPQMIRPFLHKLIYREIDIRGLIVSSFTNHTKFYFDMTKWIANGKIKIRETVVDGFEMIPYAFVGLFTGKNVGKMVVKCQ